MNTKQVRTVSLLCRAAALAALLAIGFAGTARLSATGADDPPPQKDTSGKAIGEWEATGPAPITFGQTEHVRNNRGVENDEVDGAVHVVLANPKNSGEMYIGATNGGVWKTSHANRSHVLWQKLTDKEVSQSIGAMDADPGDSSFRTIAAGFGYFSSFTRTFGGARAGVIYSNNGGATWTNVNGGGVLIEKNISGLALRGKTIVVSVNAAEPNNNDNRGVFRSTDLGATFVKVSRDDLANGLPSGIAFDLVGDPTKPNRLFVPITSANGGLNGIFRSDDTGATWTKVSDAAIDAALASVAGPPASAPSNVELAVGVHNNVYLAIARTPPGLGRLTHVFRSGDGGATWTAMSIPITPAAIPQGIHPGGQAGIHMAIAADRRNPNIVYISGDRQPDGFEEGGTQQFPNALGANNYSGRLFRGDATQPPASQWSHMTHRPTSFMPNGGTASDSSPHADSREMVMDADGNVIEVDDGGVYRRTKPQTNTGDWISLNGNLQVTEQHSLSYDGLSNVALSGNQDTGSPIQLSEDNPTWETLLSADGGDTLADDFSTPGFSIRYNSFQFLGFFIRTRWDPANTFLSFTQIALNPLGGAPPVNPQFYTPIALNRVQGNRILVGAANGLYESADRGDNVARIDLNVANGSGLDTLAYGATNNPDAIYMGAGNFVRVRLAPPPAAFTSSPDLGITVVGVQMHPDDANIAFAATNVGVFATTNGGGTWNDITGNLQTLVPARLRTLEFLVTPSGNAVVVGSLNGAFIATQASGYSVWQRLGTGLPRVPVYELQHNRADDVLVAGTLGRGAFKLRHVASVVGGL